MKKETKPPNKPTNTKSIEIGLSVPLPIKRATTHSLYSNCFIVFSSFLFIFCFNNLSSP